MRWGLLDTIDSLVPGESARGTRTWDPALPLFEDHFPGFPVVPGVLLLESLALFIRYELMVQAPLAEADEAARAIGRDRFEAFIARVGEALASGQRTLAASAKDNGGGR